MASRISPSAILRFASLAQRESASALERLSSGLRITRASDDAAGLAISSSLNADARVFNQAVRNINDSLSMTAVYESAIQELQSISMRQLELAEQAANGVLGTAQRGALQAESEALRAEYNRIVSTTSFNGVSLFQNGGVTLRTQAGYASSGSITTTLGLLMPRGESAAGTFTAMFTFSSSNTDKETNVMSGDLNGDGFADVVTKTGNGGFGVNLGNGNGTFKAQVNYITPTSHVESSLLIDVNNDSILDVVHNAQFDDGLYVSLGNVNGTFKDGASFAIGVLFAQDLAAGDFDGNGTIDMVLAEGNAARVLLGNGNGTFSSGVSYTSTTAKRAVAVGDIDGDGKLDIVTGVNTNSGAHVHLGNGNGTFKASVASLAHNLGNSIDLADLNHDGKLDIVSTGGGVTNTEVYVAFGTGTGTFTGAVSYQVGLQSGSQLSDVNSDGQLDILTMNSAGELSVLLNQGSGTFSAARSFAMLAPSLNLGFTINDFDEDGANDIIVGSDLGALTYVAGEVEDTLTLPTFSLATQAEAQTAVDTVKGIVTSLASEQSVAAAYGSRLAVAANNLRSSAENHIAAASRISDADVAEEAARLVRAKILQQGSASLLAKLLDHEELLLDLIR